MLHGAIAFAVAFVIAFAVTGGVANAKPGAKVDVTASSPLRGAPANVQHGASKMSVCCTAGPVAGSARFSTDFVVPA